MEGQESHFETDAQAATDPSGDQSMTRVTAQPLDATLEDQGNTYRCGAFATLQWWAAAGFEAETRASAAFQAACATADKQHGLLLGQVKDLNDELAEELHVPIRYLGEGWLDDWWTHDQAIKDEWCVIDLIYENAVVDPNSGTPPQQYNHYVSVDNLIELPNQYGVRVYAVKDPFHKYDGEDGIIAESDFHKAVELNGSPIVIGLALRFD